MSEMPSIIQIQEQIRDALAKMLDIDIADVKKEVSDTAQQEIRLKAMKTMDDGKFVQANMIIKQLGKNKFQIAGTIRDGENNYVIGKEIQCQVESIPSVLQKLISEAQISKPKKKKKFIIL